VHEVAKAGIARTFQNIRLFADMTALENVMVGRHIRTGSGLLGAIFRTPASRRRKPRSPSARRNCSTTSASASSPTTRRARCRTATSAAWRSPARWPPTRS
jgi:ABC-type branched-subunit amino acid transport system ATPase component